MKIIMQYGVGLEGAYKFGIILISISAWLPSLILSSRFPSGVDVNAATEHKIKVARIPGRMTGNTVSCAEMAIYLTLGVLRKQVYFYGYQFWILTRWKLDLLFTCFMFSDDSLQWSFMASFSSLSRGFLILYQVTMKLSKSGLIPSCAFNNGPRMIIDVS
jgi:hypothetical protein